MKKNMYMYIILVMIITTCLCIYFGKMILNANEKISQESNDHTETTMKAIIFQVLDEENQLLVYNSQNTDQLIYINYSEDYKYKLKEGQEIIIYYDELIDTTYPEIINNVKKIEILSENKTFSNQRETFNLDDNINMTINKFDINEFDFTINDTNETPYEYLQKYEICKKIKNDKYVKDQQKTEATNTSISKSTSSYTRHKF